MQRIYSSKQGLSAIEHHHDGTGQQMLGLRDCGGFVDARAALSEHSYRSMTMTPDVALAAYRWLGEWLQAQGIEVLPQLPAR